MLLASPGYASLAGADSTTYSRQGSVGNGWISAYTFHASDIYTVPLRAGDVVHASLTWEPTWFEPVPPMRDLYLTMGPPSGGCTVLQCLENIRDAATCEGAGAAQGHAFEGRHELLFVAPHDADYELRVHAGVGVNVVLAGAFVDRLRYQLTADIDGQADASQISGPAKRISVDPYAYCAALRE